MSLREIVAELDHQIAKALATRDHVAADAGPQSNAYAAGNLDGLATARAIVARAAGMRRPPVISANDCEECGTPTSHAKLEAQDGLCDRCASPLRADRED